MTKIIKNKSKKNKNKFQKSNNKSYKKKKKLNNSLKKKKKNLSKKGGNLNKDDDVKFIKQLREKYPADISNEVGRLISGQQGVNTVDEAHAKFEENLKISGVDIIPELGKTYLDDTYNFEDIVASTETETLKKLIPPPQENPSNLVGVDSCIFHSDPAGAVSSLQKMYKSTYLSENDKYIAQKWMKHCEWSREALPKECDNKISKLINEKQQYFIDYFCCLPFISEANGSFYDLILDYLLKNGFLTSEQIADIKKSLTWTICISISEGKPPCTGVNIGGTIKKLFCYDPFYINETIGWANVGETNINSDSWYKNNEDLIIQLVREKYPDISLDEVPPEWWIENYESLIETSIKIDDKKAKNKLKLEILNKSGYNFASLILLLEANKFSKEFLIIQTVVLIIKFMLNLYVILGHSSGYNTIQKDIEEACKEISQYILSSEEIQTGCAASMGREINTKLEHLKTYISSELVYMVETKKQLDTLESIDNAKLLTRTTTIVEDFIKIIEQRNDGALNNLIKEINKKFLDKWIKQKGVILDSVQASELGLSGSELENIMSIYLFAMTSM